MIRTFIAAPIPEEIRKKLKDIQAELRKHETGAVRWTNPEGIHLTFHFLGEIEESGVKDLGEMLKEAGSACRSFSCRVRGLGAFPNLQRPRVFWAGLETGSEAGKLHLALKAGLVRLRVIACCPIQEPMLGPADQWPTEFRAPHMSRPSGSPFATFSIADARNYLFTDGHVERIVR